MHNNYVAREMRALNSTAMTPFFVDEELDTMCFLIDPNGSRTAYSGLEGIVRYPAVLKVHDSIDDSLDYLLRPHTDSAESLLQHHLVSSFTLLDSMDNNTEQQMYLAVALKSQVLQEQVYADALLQLHQAVQQLLRYDLTVFEQFYLTSPPADADLSPMETERNAIWTYAEDKLNTKLLTDDDPCDFQQLKEWVLDNEVYMHYYSDVLACFMLPQHVEYDNWWWV